MSDEAVPPGKQGSAIASVLSGAAGLQVRLPIGLHGVLLRATLALPLLLAVFSAEMLLYAGEIAERSLRIVVHARRLRTHVHSLPHLIARSLPELPWQIVSTPVKLQVLVPLKSFVADLAHKSVRREKALRRHSNHLRIWIRHSGEISLLFLCGNWWFCQ